MLPPHSAVLTVQKKNPPKKKCCCILYIIYRKAAAGSCDAGICARRTVLPVQKKIPKKKICSHILYAEMLLRGRATQVYAPRQHTSAYAQLRKHKRQEVLRRTTSQQHFGICATSRCPTHIHTHSLTHTHSLSLTHSLTHTHTHTHTQHAPA
jgi:hypothetical protein